MAATDRLEIRLDTERRARLMALTQEQGVTVSALVRGLIDRAYEESLRARRRRAAQQLCELEVEDVPDPETLNRQLDSTHDLGPLY
jgi:hypothetical protein